MSRFVFIMLDGVGVGALPDAADYGDASSDTLGNLSRTVDLRLPFLRRLGLGNIVPLLGVPPVSEPLCLPGRLATLSAGKDTTVGHWEHMGLVTTQPFPTYPRGLSRGDPGPFRGAHRPARTGQQAGFRHGDHRRTWRGAHGQRQADRLHVGRQRLSDRRSCGCGAARTALCVVSDSP